MIETQIAFVLSALDALATSTVPLEVLASAEAAYTAEMDALSQSTVWLGGGCQSWYVDGNSRRLTLLWPEFAYAFRDRNATFDPSAFAAAGR
jgi:hypothetical protein